MPFFFFRNQESATFHRRETSPTAAPMASPTRRPRPCPRTI